MSFTEEWAKEVPEDFRDASLNDWPEPIALALLNWSSSLYEDESRNLKGNNLVISGPVGAGKTRASFSIMRHLWFTGVPENNPRPRWTWFLPVTQLLVDLRGEHEDRKRALIKTGSIILLDDLGSTRMTEWGLEQVYWIANLRRNDRAPMIITTNLEMGALENIFGEPIYSRLINGHAHIRLSGEDRRK